MKITISGYGILLHRKEQWDLPCYNPLLVCHVLTPNSGTRLFCIGKRG